MAARPVFCSVHSGQTFEVIEHAAECLQGLKQVRRLLGCVAVRGGVLLRARGKQQSKQRGRFRILIGRLHAEHSAQRDAIHGAGVEIVVPQFLRQRVLQRHRAADSRDDRQGMPHIDNRKRALDALGLSPVVAFAPQIAADELPVPPGLQGIAHRLAFIRFGMAAQNTQEPEQFRCSLALRHGFLVLANGFVKPVGYALRIQEAGCIGTDSHAVGGDSAAPVATLFVHANRRHRNVHRDVRESVVAAALDTKSMHLADRPKGRLLGRHRHRRTVFLIPGAKHLPASIAPLDIRNNSVKKRIIWVLYM
ncbi:MAG: hypothetical protein F4Z28_12970 [Gammaproteobacteria bacterium]|nr:hypothetical protein [Gammaproteobacteria bacterium]